jgi:hypothetical protein
MNQRPEMNVVFDDQNIQLRNINAQHGGLPLVRSPSCPPAYRPGQHSYFLRTGNLNYTRLFQTRNARDTQGWNGETFPADSPFDEMDGQGC